MFVPMSIYTFSAPAHNGGPSSACTVGKLDHSSARLAGEARVPSDDIFLAPGALQWRGAALGREGGSQGFSTVPRK